jgi:non-specific serine/threonine protein kinase
LFGNEIPVAKEYLKALIVLPSSLVFNWYNEARKFTPHFRRVQYVGQDRKLISKKLEKYDLIFELCGVSKRSFHFRKVPISFLILDESQYIKIKNSKIFKAINQIKTTHKIVERYSYRKLIRRFVVSNAIYQSEYFGSYAFAEHYKVPIEDETVCWN